MNNMRIKIYLDELLSNYEQTPALLEQKEELLSHLTERVQDNMAKGLSYDEAFDATIKGIGDVEALVGGIVSKRKIPENAGMHHEISYHDSNPKGQRAGKKLRKLIRRIAVPLVSMSPFIYLILGIAFGWWAWAWVIIPMAGVFNAGDWRAIITGWSPFIYFLLGWFFGWWAWGWLIIPISGTLFTIGKG